MRKWNSLSVEERSKVYRGVMSLYSRKGDVPRTWREVTRRYRIGISRETVRSWVMNKRNPFRKFFGRLIAGPSADLAYVIMAAKGDGCSGKRFNGKKGFLYNVDFRVKDLDFANQFALNASRALNRGTPYRVRPDRHGFYVVNIHSKAMYELLEKIPRSSSQCQKYLARPPAIARMGVRGFFDAEGGPSVSINKRGEFVAEVQASNSDIEMIRLANRLLFEVGILARVEVGRSPPHFGRIDGRVIWFAKPTHELRISRIVDVLKFIEEIGSSIGRKQVKMLDIGECLKLKAKDRAKAWRALYHKDGKGEYQRNLPLRSPPNFSTR